MYSFVHILRRIIFISFKCMQFVSVFCRAESSENDCRNIEKESYSDRCRLIGMSSRDFLYSLIKHNLETRSGVLAMFQVGFKRFREKIRCVYFHWASLLVCKKLDKIQLSERLLLTGCNRTNKLDCISENVYVSQPVL